MLTRPHTHATGGRRVLAASSAWSYQPQRDTTPLGPGYSNYWAAVILHTQAVVGHLFAALAALSVSQCALNVTRH